MVCLDTPKQSSWRNSASPGQIGCTLFLFFHEHSKLSLKVSFKAIVFGVLGFVVNNCPSLLNKHCSIAVVAELLFFFLSFCLLPTLLFSQWFHSRIDPFPRLDFLIIASLEGSLQLVQWLLMWTSCPGFFFFFWLISSSWVHYSFPPLKWSNHTSWMMEVRMY